MSAKVLPFLLSPGRRLSKRPLNVPIAMTVIPRIKQVADEFLPEDLASLEAQLSLLAGDWLICASGGEATLLRHSGWEALRQTVVIRRKGDRLRLMIDRPPAGLETVGLFCDMTIVMEVLAGYVGSRRRRRMSQRRRLNSLQ